MSAMAKNAINQDDATPRLGENRRKALDGACAKIAPTWPLDELIAVNPWWEMRSMTLPQVSSRLAALTQAHCLMPKIYFETRWMEQIQPEHLERAVTETGASIDVHELEAYLLEHDEVAHWHNISDLLDSSRDRQHKMAWRDEITHQISQFCAFYFHNSDVASQFTNETEGLYEAWLSTTQVDKGIEIVMDEEGLTRFFSGLPSDAEALLSMALNELGIADEYVELYAHALLLDINGWASWVAYLRWQDRLNGEENHLMMELLAIRVAWELVIWRYQRHKYRSVFARMNVLWRHQMSTLPRLIDVHTRSQKKGWIWQRAAEIAYQEGLHKQLCQGVPSKAQQPMLQAAFCIDVRSEPMRRALESLDARIQTIGFAGFFGLPIEYQPSGTTLKRPQLPGLLKASIKAQPRLKPKTVKTQSSELNRKARWAEWGMAAPATFSMVESSGMMYVLKLLKESFFPSGHGHPVNDLPVGREWELTQNEAALSTDQLVETVHAILKAMGLDRRLAPWVLLVGHGSCTSNNPHAAGLDCGACGGQTGELNVRILCHLLNQPEIRRGLQTKGVPIAQDTRFVAALHNTMTDEIRCFDTDGLDTMVDGWLERAGELVRKERAGQLGLPAMSDEDLRKTLVRRSRDWSQVRPEWGLAGNAAFIAASRERTRGLDLQGRVFLHDYDADSDEGFALLEQIMTAPMVVANWINLQYYASVCDNYRYGSGNKVLHNVVGGNIGVFEGNGGDLRIGLPMQSLHNGEEWMHEPLRLSVYIDAPRHAIEQVVQHHESLYNLIDNGWLYLFHWSGDGEVYRYHHGSWEREIFLSSRDEEAG
ncbi:MAG TPA: DUF2309 domain-containing protein [Mariprofundaceae bacterium]|nr:DUF2309 domain-containing protein [Mariprofundaceae bacterium]